MSYGGGYGGASYRREEKEDLKRLNDRLCQYIQKVRTAADTGGINNQTFTDLFKLMEDDLNALRKMYEREMDGLRQELMEANREKNANKAEADKYKKLAQELEDRLRAAEDRNRQLQSEVGELQHRVNQLERDLYDERNAAKAPREQLANLQSQMSAVDGKNDELQRRLGEEMVKRRAADDKADQLQKKLDFNEQLNKEQMKKADELLKQSKDHIAKMENQCKELEKQGQTYPDLLEQMRQKMDAELEAYKRDCEDTHRRNLADMKNRLDAQGGTIQELRNVIHGQQAENDKLKDKIRQLEAQIKELQKQKSALEDAVNKERGRGADAVRDLEKKLKDLQDKLHAMMQEANADKDQSLRLRAEIDTYACLLGDEEKRMRTSLNPAHGTGMYRPQMNTAYQPSSRLANVSGGNLNDKSKYMYSGQDADRSRAQSSMGVAGEGTKPPHLCGRRSPLTEYMDKYRFGSYRAPGAPMTARGYQSDSLPHINAGQSGDLRGSGVYGNPQSGNIRYGQPAQAY